MRPRVLLRTHYQADEPRLIIAAVTHASSATESRSDDSVAATLERWARASKYVLSTPGAMYAIDNARHLGLLNGSNRWMPGGLAFAFLNTITPPLAGMGSRVLTPPEERLYMERYLVAAGALVVKFGRWLLEHGSTTGGQLRDESIIENLLADALGDYLEFTSEVRDRSQIRRERDRLGKAEYGAATKRHKRYPLIKTMSRLCLLDTNGEDDELKRIAPDREGRLTALSGAIPDIVTLERLVRNDELRNTLDTALKEQRRTDLHTQPSPTALLLQAYSFAIQRGLQACPLAYLDYVLDGTSPKGPGGRTLGAEQLLEPIHRAEPRDVRFHVDRQGRRAFVLISDLAQDKLVAINT